MWSETIDPRETKDSACAPSEPDLIERAIVGDHKALKMLMARAVPTIRHQLQASVPSEFQSVLTIDDVIQESLINVFLGISRFVPQGKDSFSAWVYEISRNTLREATRMLRTQKRGGNRKRLDIAASDDSRDVLLDQLIVSTLTPSREVSQIEMRTKLDSAIEQLPDTPRQVIRLYDIDRLSAERVASAIQRSVGAMYMIRARAIRRLSELLENVLSR